MPPLFGAISGVVGVVDVVDVVRVVGDVAALVPPATGIAAPDSDLAAAERALELVGLFMFAVSGGMLAVRKGFEVVGVTALACTTALGGGIIRDLILGDTPPLAFRDVLYLVVPLVAACVVFVGHSWIRRSAYRSVLVFDAIGLGLFTVTGAVKAAAFPTTAIGAVLLGVVTAVGGGILRDVLANEEPQLFQRHSRLYSIPSAVGAVIVVASARNGWYSGAIGLAVACAVCGVRLAALRFGWRAPRPFRSPAAD